MEGERLEWKEVEGKVRWGLNTPHYEVLHTLIIQYVSCINY